MILAPETTQRRLTPEFIATLFIVAAYIFWVLSLPVWPSQDGPVHLYYTHILGALLSHQPTVYSHYFTIKHLLPPYALYYYALLALSKVVSLLLADRLIVCAYILSFVFGFRYLAGSVGSEPDRPTLLVLLLTLNWSAGMGFLNYCLSLSFVFWALGLWFRFSRKGFSARLLFLLLVSAITLTHPVPLLILLTFCGVDWLRRLVGDYRKCARLNLSPALLADLAILLLSSLALVYIKHFATTHPLSQAQSEVRSFPGHVLHNIHGFLALHYLSLIFGHSVPILFYRFGQLMTIGIGFGLAIAQHLRNRAAHRWTPGDTWLLSSIVLLILLPLLPSDVSGAFYFTERLSILIWLTPLVAASGWTPLAEGTLTRRSAAQPRSLISAAILIYAIATNLCLLWQADRILRPIAQQIAAVEHTPRAHTGELALILEDSRPGDMGTSGPSWSPLYWAGVHLLRHDDAILDNAPWLDSAIIPLGAQPTIPVAASATGDSASPHKLSLKLLSSPAARASVLAPVDLVLITQPGRPAPTTLDPVLAPAPSAPGAAKSWSCRMGSSWYQLCVPQGASASGPVSVLTDTLEVSRSF